MRWLILTSHKCTLFIPNLFAIIPFEIFQICRKVAKRASCLLTFLLNFSELTFYTSNFSSLSSPSVPHTSFFWNVGKLQSCCLFASKSFKVHFLKLFLYNHNTLTKIRKLSVTYYLIYRLYANLTNCPINSHYYKRESKCLFLVLGSNLD